jgi:exosortase/archaeosortase family protein
MATPPRTGARRRTERDSATKQHSLRLRIIRFVALTVVGFGAVCALLDSAAIQRLIVAPYDGFVALCCRGLLALLGVNAWGAASQIQSSEFSVDILSGCEGLYITGILIVAIIAFPTKWKHRLFGILGGFVCIYFVNILRILVLFFLGSKHPEMFRSAHLIYGQGIIIVLSAGLWFLWASLISRDEAESCNTVSR